MDLLSFSRPVILLLVFAAVVLLAWGGLSSVGTYRAVRRRVAQQVQVAAGGGG